MLVACSRFPFFRYASCKRFPFWFLSRSSFVNFVDKLLLERGHYYSTLAKIDSNTWGRGQITRYRWRKRRRRRLLFDYREIISATALFDYFVNRSVANAWSANRITVTTSFRSPGMENILIGAIFSLTTIEHAVHLNILAMVMHTDASSSIFHAGMRLWMRRWSSYLCIAYLSMRVHGYANKLAEADDGDCIFPAATSVRGLIESV